MIARDARIAIQAILHTKEDGVTGPVDQRTLALLASLPDNAPWPAVITPAPNGVHLVKGTSFADPSDIEEFLRCKAQGNSDLTCFARGDNGIGKWGDDCRAGSGPKCALPPEVWANFPTPRHARILITNPARLGSDGKPLSVVALMDDTMPHLNHITNGAGIDMNKDCCDALQISIPADARVTWRIADPLP